MRGSVPGPQWSLTPSNHSSQSWPSGHPPTFCVYPLGAALGAGCGATQEKEPLALGFAPCGPPNLVHSGSLAAHWLFPESSAPPSQRGKPTGSRDHEAHQHDRGRRGGLWAWAGSRMGVRPGGDGGAGSSALCDHWVVHFVPSKPHVGSPVFLCLECPVLVHQTGLSGRLSNATSSRQPSWVDGLHPTITGPTEPPPWSSQVCPSTRAASP